MSSKAPSVYEYLDHLQFMKATVEHLKERGRYSARMFARRAELKSPSHLKMIMDGKRKMAPETIQKVAKGLNLKTTEARFFELLVLFNQAKSETDKDGFYKRLLHFKKFIKIQKATADQYEYFSNWYNVVVREALTTRWADQPIEKLANAIGISQAKCKEAIKLLESLELIKKTKKGWVAAEGGIQTDQEIQSLVVRNYHKQMIEKSLESLEQHEPTDRDMSGLTIAVRKEQLSEIKKRVAELRRELNAVYSADKEADQIYQLNIQFFPMIEELEE